MTRTLIMGVPWQPQRTKRAVELAQAAGGEVVWDQTQNAFDTWRTVLAVAGADPIIMLEDDVKLAARWRERVEEAIAEHPNDVIQFFSLRNESESGYRSGRTYLMNQCHYLPAGVAARLLEYSSDWVERNPRFKTGTDTAIAYWLKENKLKYWMHVPSLVQHEDWKSEINPKRPRNRQSLSFEGAAE